jgi:hypothetical protein
VGEDSVMTNRLPPVWMSKKNSFISFWERFSVTTARVSGSLVQ